jgi:carboxyl-terminal processing protease
MLGYCFTSAVRLSKLVIGAACLLLVAACASELKFESTTYEYESANKLFGEALTHLADNYIDPIDLRLISVAGVNGLTEFDPSVRAAAGIDGSYLVYAGGVQPAHFKAPSDRDARAWASLLAEATSIARERSETLREMKPDALYTAVMNGITKTLDGYSRYEPPKRANESRARREGYGGIGVTIRDIEGKTVIQEVMPKSPAERIGLQAKDVITHANSIPFVTLEREDRAEQLRGPIGQSVAVSIKREGVPPFTVRIEREEIIPTTVYFENDKGLARFRITAFSRNTADSLTEEIAKAERSTGGLNGIVLDLRGNPGGYLTQAVNIADLFLESGVVVATHGRHPSSSSSYKARAGTLAAGKPVILLIDGGSASASELLAAALVDAGRAAAVGSTSYGKGSIQNLEPLANGGELIITWSRMHAPSGYLLDGLGVRPTVCTAEAANQDANDVIRASRQDVQSAKLWRAYKTPHKPSATRLRATCPKVEAGGDLDISVARALLENRQAYKAALSPAGDEQNHSILFQRRATSG